MRINRFAAVCAAGLFAICSQSQAIGSAETGKLVAIPAGSGAAVEKSTSAESLASRATVSGAATVYGGFAIASTATVYILVRGPSLRTLNVTQNALDAPWVRLYNSAGTDLVTTGTTVGFATCLSTAATDTPVVNHYQVTRNAPVQPRDACIAATLPAGAYTFTVTPSVPGFTSPPGGVSSVPSSGEILFEVTLGPTAAVVDNNQTRTERLVGGTWTYTYTILSTFSDSYTFTSVGASTQTPGDYNAFGTDRFGNSVIGTYASSLQQWAVLDPSIIIDLFFVFTFSDNNHVSGCYHQINPPGSTNIGQCYAMTGNRFPLKSMTSNADPLRLQQMMEAAGQGLETDTRVIDAYLRARRQLQER